MFLGGVKLQVINRKTATEVDLSINEVLVRFRLQHWRSADRDIADETTVLLSRNDVIETVACLWLF